MTHPDDLACRDWGGDIRLPIAIIRLRKTCGQMSRRGSELSNSADACFTAHHQSSQVGQGGNR